MPNIELFHMVSGAQNGQALEASFRQVGPNHVCVTEGWPPLYIIIVMI